MTPTEIRNYFQMLQSGLISRKDYERVMTQGLTKLPEPEAVQVELPIEVKSQKEKLLHFLLDGQPHTTTEILEKIYGGQHLGIARIGARIWDLKQDGYEIKSWSDQFNRSIWWYKLIK